MTRWTVAARGRTGRVRPGRSVLAALLVPVLVGAVGCGEEPEFEWPEDPAPEPTRTLDPGEADAVDDILVVFDEYRRAEVAAQADPQPGHVAQDQLRPYLGDPLLTLTLLELETMHRRGLVRQGEPHWQSTVTEVDLDGVPPTATIRDCLDATDWQLADAGGRPVDPGGHGLPARYAPDQYVMEFTASFVADRWLIDDRTEGDGPC